MQTNSIGGTNYDSIEEWRAEATRRFGPNDLEWAFVCPACKHVQRPIDFRPLKKAGHNVNAETARFNCIGRYLPNSRDALGLGGGSVNGTGPCNYTGGGLFDLRPDKIRVGPDQVRSFALAPAPSQAPSVSTPAEAVN